MWGRGGVWGLGLVGLDSHDEQEIDRMASDLAAALLAGGLRSNVHRAYDLGQTTGLTILGNVEGLEEERRDALGHRLGVEAVIVWVKACRAAGGMFLDRNLVSVVDNVTCISLGDDLFRVVSHAFTILG